LYRCITDTGLEMNCNVGNGLNLLMNMVWIRIAWMRSIVMILELLKLENYHCLMIICGFVLLNLCMNGEDDVLMSFLRL
jgi:hypothetical protein